MHNLNSEYQTGISGGGKKTTSSCSHGSSHTEGADTSPSHRPCPLFPHLSRRGAFVYLHCVCAGLSGSHELQWAPCVIMSGYITGCNRRFGCSLTLSSTLACLPQLFCCPGPFTDWPHAGADATFQPTGRSFSQRHKDAERNRFHRR